MIGFIEHIKNTTQMRLNGVHKFKVKIPMQFEAGSYIVKTADTEFELIESFRLRHEVFSNEFKGHNRPGLDFDRFDTAFDHLIIYHAQLNQVIGTYRLNCTSNLDTRKIESYTGLEFDLSEIERFNGPYLELGRACIKREYRKGSVISLLWRGIAEYMRLSQAEVLFGCSSLKINSPREAALIYTYLKEENFLTTQIDCKPTRKFEMQGLDAWMNYFSLGLKDYQKEEAKDLIPSLLNSYLKLGAKVAGLPAFDVEFDCIDLLTILEKNNLSNSLATKLQIHR